ncbi:hypothetical protein MIMGU_mgv1a018310mg, partial [Erythranthe guttata]
VPENNEDFISKLPDEILVSILSRTSTKDSIRSCVLSKRWRDLYKFVPSVTLRCTDLVKRGGDHDAHSSYLVTNRLRNYLLLRSGSRIRSFSFRCCEPRSSDRFVSCVHSLARLGVEELVLHFSLPFRFSCHLLFEMQSLKYFHLKWCYLIRNWKSQKYCNSLQTLELTSVTVLYYGALDCIFSNCLSLESLKIEECTFYDKLWISGSLKSLQIKACKGVKEIEMGAPNLVRFEFIDSKLRKLIFKHVPQLQTIYLRVLYEFLRIYPIRRTLAKDLPQLKSLSVYTEGDFFQVRENKHKPILYFFVGVFFYFFFNFSG